MAQHQSGKVGVYDRSTSPLGSATTPNQPRPVEIYDRPARNPWALRVTLIVIALSVLVLLGVFFLP